MRITQGMWFRSVMGNVNRSYERMAGIDLRRRILKPSDDPAGTEQLVRLRSLLNHNEQYQQNVSSASRWLDYSENALSAITDGLRNAKELALTAADDSNSLDGIAEEVDAIFQQMLTLANSNYGGRYIFSGSAQGGLPFELVGEQVRYHGDDAELSAAISNSLSLRYNMPGSDLFSAREASLAGSLDWDPAANWATSLDRLFDGQGLEAGKIRIVDGAGDGFVVDLRGSASLDDIRTRIEAAVPGLAVSLVDGQQLLLSDTAHPGATIRVEDIQGGYTAEALGISGSGEGGTILGRDLDPVMDDATLLTDLRGLNLPLGKIGVRIGDARSATELDLSAALSVGDLRSLINTAFPELDVSIAASGNSLAIVGTGYLPFAIENVEGASSAALMGLAGEAYPNRPFEVLIDLKSAVETGDRQAVQRLLPELDEVRGRILSARADLGTRLNLAEDTLSGLQSRNVSLTESLSEVGDVDMAEALLMYQNAESVYQASLLLASNIYQMTLANYL